MIKKEERYIKDLINKQQKAKTTELKFVATFRSFYLHNHVRFHLLASARQKGIEMFNPKVVEKNQGYRLWFQLYMLLNASQFDSHKSSKMESLNQLSTFKATQNASLK